MPCSQCRTNASELSSALAVYLFSWMILLSVPSRRKSASFFVRFGCLPVTVYASRLLGVVRAVRKATIHTAYVFSLRLHPISLRLPSLAKSGGAFGIITAFIAYYVGLSELLVTVLPIGAFSPLNFTIPRLLYPFSASNTTAYHNVSSIPRVLNSNRSLQLCPCYHYNTTIWCVQISQALYSLCNYLCLI